ncbi:hypothetical protein DFH07DRAFT_743702 [Mycena maculata]|uniref:Uncharacterized protein n=1 Tax=Mycena maculata TaxID=230809 RepID=A0AAD7J2A2_9AGAR|nr:hypothetical protein DFH07DRAFT_743702 [Mycena maculata]
MAEPTTALERELQAALREQQAKNKVQKSQMVAMQSALVLNGAYCDLVRGKNKKKKGRLVGDGLPRLLTAREACRRVREERHRESHGVREAEGLALGEG